MNNNGMIKYKESFIIQIKKFFKKLFGKKEEQYNYCQQEPVNEIAKEKTERQSDFTYNIKVDTKTVNSVIDKKNFIEKIKGNEEVLNMLSIDRLKKLEKYYDSVIAENEKKIRKLKAQI